jgi:hypothetical protein
VDYKEDRSSYWEGTGRMGAGIGRVQGSSKQLSGGLGGAVRKLGGRWEGDIGKVHIPETRTAVGG